MRRSWGVLASALLAVALEVAIKLVADSVTVPRKYYFVPVGVFVVLVALQVVLTLRDQQAAERGRARAAVRVSGGRHIIRGVWQRPSGSMVYAIVMVASLCLFLGGLRLTRKTPAGLLIAILFFVVLLAALCAWVGLGSRVSLEFSVTGVAVRRGLGRKRRLRWDEATNFHAESYRFVAERVRASTWYLQGWDFDDPSGVILICDLARAGIVPAAVEAAVDYWTRTREQRS
jgi:hypothetical protein